MVNCSSSGLESRSRASPNLAVEIGVVGDDHVGVGDERRESNFGPGVHKMGRAFW